LSIVAIFVDFLKHPEYLLQIALLVVGAGVLVLAGLAVLFPFAWLADVLERRADRKRFAPRPGQSERRRLEAQPGDRCLCGGTFKVRRRKADGVRFLGCANYPKCRETRTLALVRVRREGR
jgi:topoisomerase-like DNA binding C4 zinc finger protein